MTTLEILEQARDRIRNPENWKQGALGFREEPHCAMGVLKMVVGESRRWNYPALCKHPAAQRLVSCLPVDSCESVAYFNDTHTHAEVLELFNLAIAEEIKKQDDRTTRAFHEEAEREAAEDPAAPMVFA